MKRSKGYILAEILTSMLLQAGFVLVLCGAFYILVSFSSASQQVLVARQRGQRVVQYLDSRIRSAGLGFYNCFNFENGATTIFPGAKGVKEALQPFMGSRFRTGLKLPVALEFLDNSTMTGTPRAWATYQADNGHRIQYGNMITFLYAKRNTSADINLVVTVDTAHADTPPVTKPNIQNPLWLIEEKWSDDSALAFVEANANLIVSSRRVDEAKRAYDRCRGRGYSISTSIFCSIVNEFFSYLANREKWETINRQINQIRERITDSDLVLDINLAYTYKFLSSENNFEFVISENLNSWCVMAGTGTPFKIVSNLNFEYAGGFAPASDIHTADELLYLKCERMFAADEADGRSFYFQELSDDWSDRTVFQDGILELYFELDTNTNILDLYVLSSGGKDGKVHSRPQNWPGKARWKSDYGYHVIYISKASWKLENIPDNFVWNS